MTSWLQLLIDRDPRALTAVLLFCLFGIHTLATNLAWRWESLPARRWPRPVSTLARVGYELLRVVFYVGPLYLALLFGWIDLRAVGLGPLGTLGIDWANGVAWIVVLGLGAWGLLMLIWAPYRRATVSLGEHYTPEEWASSPRRGLEVLLMQAHWAFYRGAFVLLVSNIYAGTILALGLTLAEAWSDPKVRRYFVNVGQVESGAWSAGLAIISTLAYLLTLNLWLVASLHLVLEFAVPHLRLRPAATETEPEYSPLVEPTPLLQLPPASTRDDQQTG